jgi:hypothetical protein
MKAQQFAIKLGAQTFNEYGVGLKFNLSLSRTQTLTNT